MEIKDKIDYKWGKIVEKAYEQNEDFDYKKTKKIVKETKSLEKEVYRMQQEVLTTLELTDFNDNLELESELKDFVSYSEDFLEYLTNFTKLEPTSKQGYYNYLKNMMGFL